MSATHTQILICSSLHRLKFYGIDLAKICVLLYKLILLAIQKAYLKFCCWIHSKCFSFTLSSSFKTLTCVVVKWPSIKWSCETFFFFRGKWCPWLLYPSTLEIIWEHWKSDALLVFFPLFSLFVVCKSYNVFLGIPWQLINLNHSGHLQALNKTYMCSYKWKQLFVYLYL